MKENILSLASTINALTIFEINTLDAASWSGANTAVSATLAPNGDTCEQWSNSGSSCKLLDIAPYIGNQFTIGCYFQPSTYQAQYGNSPPQGVVCQIGHFGTYYVSYTALSGSGSASYPLTDLFKNNAGLTVNSPLATPIGTWRHLAIGINLPAKTFTVFQDGQLFDQASLNTSLTLSTMCYFGGIGDRSGIVGADASRYGYRGLISAIRLYSSYMTESFDPLTF